MRRAFIVLLLLAIIAAITWWLWGWGGTRAQRGDAWRMVPANAAAIIEVPSPLSTWERFKSTSQLWNSWSGYPGCRTVDSIMVSLRTAFDVGAETGRMTDASDLLIVLTTAEDGFNTTLCWSFNDRRAHDRFEAALPGMRGRQPFNPGAALPPMESILLDDVLLISTSSQELTDAIARLSDPPVATDSLLSKARQSLGEGSDAHLLVHTARSQRLLTTWLRPEAMDALSELDGWAAVDVRARPEATLFSGLLFTAAPPRLLLASEDQGSGTANMGRVLPSRIATLWQANVTDPLRFCGTAAGDQDDAALFDAYGAWTYGAVGIATAGSVSDSTARAWAVLPTEDPLRASQALTARCTGGCDTLAYRTVRMTRSADTSALAAVWGPAFERFERPWWCVLGDRVVFSEQVNALREAIDAWADGSSFQQDARNGSFFQRYASEAGYTWWCDGAAGLASLRPGMKERGTKAYNEHRDGWQSLGGCLVQLVPEGAGRYQLTACLSGTGAAVALTSGGTSDALWSVTVGAPIIAGPYLLTDHLSRTKQILVQDKKNRIHLISCTGKVLWQREIDGPILGDVHQVDRYKNGKLQMLFNTAGRVYLIDRNGENVEHFPIGLVEQASAPLNVFDYDGQREYRVLVPTVEARLLNFDMNGKAVEGWVPPKTASTCDVPVQHLRIRGKDYVLMVDHGGQVAVLDRRGISRYAPELRAAGAARFIGLKGGLDIGTTTVLWLDQDGNAMSGTLDGEISTLAKKEEDAASTAPSLLRVEDMDHDGHDNVLIFQGDSAQRVEGAIALATDRSIAAEGVGVAIIDINLDGTLDKVTVAGDGRVSVTAVP